MADKDLSQGQSLLPTDQTRYKEIADGVYALVMAAISLDAAGNIVEPDPGLQAVRDDRAVCYWRNAITPGVAQTVLTTATAGPTADTPGIVYNLEAGEQVLFTGFCFQLLTSSDNCIFELGYTDAVDGAGNFTPCTPALIFRTGAAGDGFAGQQYDVNPPGIIRYSQGARSITYRVDANDANAQISVAWHGWREEET